MKCTECGTSKNITVFTYDQPDNQYCICDKCWIKKLEKGNAKTNSYKTSKKYFSVLRDFVRK